MRALLEMKMFKRDSLLRDEGPREEEHTGIKAWPSKRQGALGNTNVEGEVKKALLELVMPDLGLY